MPSKKILLIGNYGAGNLGDDAILGALVHLIEQSEWKGEILVTSGASQTSPEIYKKVTRVPFAPAGLRSFWKAKGETLPKEWEEVSLAILGGGGLFTDEESWKAPWIWQRQTAALKKAHIPYIGMGQSIGALHFLSRLALQSSVNSALYYRARDEASLKRLSTLNTSTPLAKGTDLALHLPLPSLKTTSPRQNIALVHLRLWPSQSKKALKNLYLKLCQNLRHQGLTPQLMSLESSNPKELLFLKTLDPNLFIPTSVEELLEKMRHVQLVVGMRLHGSLLSALTETPTCALSYSNKVSDLLSEFENLPVFQLESPDFNAEKIVFNLKTPHYKYPEKLKEEQDNLKVFLTQTILNKA